MNARQLAGSMLVAWTAWGPAWAQDEPAEATGELQIIPVEEAAAETQATVLEDVVVTATKRRAPLREIPASIVALDGAALEAQGAFEMRDYLRNIPGVQLTEIQPDLSRISIRGIQLDAGGNTPEATGLFIDDIPLNDPFLNQPRPDLAPFDLAGIEVLKGPQGTLFGGSGLAGAVRYKLADAQPGTWELKSFAQYQDVAEGSPRRLGGVAMNVPLGAAAALRLSGTGRDRGGVIDDVRNDVPDTDSGTTTNSRAVLRWDFGDAFALRLKALRHDGRTDDPSVAENDEGRLERERALRSSSPSRTRFDVYAMDFDWAGSWADLASRTSAVRKQAAYANANAERTLGTESSGQPADSPTTADVEGFVQEVRLLSPDDPESPWQWLVGVYGQDYASLTTQQLFTQDAVTGQPVVLLDFVADVTAHELALFGEMSRRLGERWIATLGARTYTIETAGTVVSTGTIILATGSPENRNDAAIEAEGVNPKVALQFDASQRIAVFASAARGFRFGGIQIVGPSPSSPDVPRTYAPDSLWSYELGVRTGWLDGTLQVDAAAFYIDWRQPQVNTISGGAVPLNVIDNVEGARSAGGELAFRYLTPIAGLAIGLSGAYTDARTTAAYATSRGTAPAGSRLPGYAQYQGAGEARYGCTWGALGAEATLSHVIHGKGVSDIMQSLEIYDYSSTDLRVAFHDAVLPAWLRLSVAVTNLADERAVVSALVVSDGNYTTVYNRPRTYEARLDLQF